MGRNGRDVRLALRGLRYSATFTVAVIATLGISIGMSTAMFTVYKTVLIDRFPIAAQDQIVVMHTVDHNGTNLDIPNAYLPEIARDTARFRSVAGVYHGGVIPTPFLNGGIPIQLGAVLASPTSSIYSACGRSPDAFSCPKTASRARRRSSFSATSRGASASAARDPSISHTLVLPGAHQTAEIVRVWRPLDSNIPRGANAWLPFPPGAPGAGRHRRQACTECDNGGSADWRARTYPASEPVCCACAQRRRFRYRVSTRSPSAMRLSAVRRR